MLQTSTPPASELQRSVTLLVKALSTTEAELGRPGRGGAVGVSCISTPGVLEGRHGEATLNGAEGGSAHPPTRANPLAVPATPVAISLRPWPVEESKNVRETQQPARIASAARREFAMLNVLATACSKMVATDWAPGKKALAWLCRMLSRSK
jgi:hypothetical protein